MQALLLDRVSRTYTPEGSGGASADPDRPDPPLLPPEALDHIKHEVRKAVREEVGNLVRRPQLLTIQGVADMLGVSVRTVETMIGEALLRPVRIRSCRRVPVSQVDALIRAHGRGSAR